jgi:hypothetical protein
VADVGTRAGAEFDEISHAGRRSLHRACSANDGITNGDECYGAIKRDELPTANHGPYRDPVATHKTHFPNPMVNNIWRRLISEHKSIT